MHRKHRQKRRMDEMENVIWDSEHAANVIQHNRLTNSNKTNVHWAKTKMKQEKEKRMNIGTTTMKTGERTRNWRNSGKILSFPQFSPPHFSPHSFIHSFIWKLFANNVTTSLKTCQNYFHKTATPNSRSTL